jgi:hypothetical protein
MQLRVTPPRPIDAEADRHGAGDQPRDGRACRRALRLIAACTLLDVPPTSRCYEPAQPGELVHLDVKKLALIVRVGHRISGDRRDPVRGAGWQYAHMGAHGHR